MAKTSVFEGLPDNLPKPEVKPDPLPEELQGKSQTEIYEILKQEHQRIVGELEAKKAEAPAQPPASAQPAPRFVPPQQQQQNIPDPSYDPEGYSRFITDQATERLRPVVTQTLNSLKEMGRTAIASAHPEEYNEYKGEIEQFMDSLSPEIQADPRSWTTALRFVKSLHEEEITDKKAKKLAEEMLKEMGIAVPEGGQPAPKKGLFGTNVAPVTTMPRSSAAPQRSRMSEKEQKIRRYIAPTMTDKEWEEYKKLNTDITTMQEGEKV